MVKSQHLFSKLLSTVMRALPNSDNQTPLLEQHVESWNNHSKPIQAWVNQESTPMGTAGSVRLLAEHLTETFVVGSGDSVASFDIRALLRAHRESGAKVTMALWEVEDPTEFGIVGLSSTHLGPLDGQLRRRYICLDNC